jgi:hypothetical protein
VLLSMRRDSTFLPRGMSTSDRSYTWRYNDLPRAVCHANHSARMATRVAMIPKDICSMLSSSMMMYVCVPRDEVLCRMEERVDRSNF